MATKSVKPQTKKQATIEKVFEVMERFSGDRLTLRQIHYQLVASLFYENTQYNYKRLSRILVEARLAGQIPFHRMVDKTRSTVGGNDFGNVGRASGHLQWKKEEFEDAETTFKNSPSWWRSPRWFKQPKYVEVWLEKEALSDTVAKSTGRDGITLVPCKGYSSLTYLKEGADRLKDRKEEIVILFLGDWDPSGLDIRRDIQEKLEMFGVEVEFKVVALSLDQIRDLKLPPMPTKKSDSRSSQFVAEFGDQAVELDAIPPDVLRLMVTEAIDAEFDEGIHQKVKVRDKRVKAWLNKEIEAYLEEKAEEQET